MAETNYSLDSGGEKASFLAPDLPYQPIDPKHYHPKIGLIACGGITASHLGAYRAAGYDVVALCDASIERAEGRRDEFFPQASVYANSADLLGRTDIEVVDIAAHPAEREALIEAALKAGKHVLSQKPFVTNLDAGERLVALASEVGRKLAVNQNGRWSPHFSYLRQAIQRGYIGDVTGVHLGVHWNHGWIAGSPFDEVYHVVLYDFAIHWFDILTCFMGDRTSPRVFASVAYAPGQTAKPPLLGQALVEYPGAQATLAFDAATPVGSLDSTIITGTKGVLRSTGPDLSNQTVSLTTADGVASPVLEGKWFNDGFHGTMAELLCAIEENREPSNSARNNLKSLALCFAALRSAETGLPQIPGGVRRLTNHGS